MNMKTGLISDIHEDYRSLSRAIRRLEKLGADELFCLGDISGYSERYYRYNTRRSARKCWELVLRECALVLPGNHDLYAIRKTPELFKRLGLPDNWYQLTLPERQSLARERVWLYEPDEAPNDLHPSILDQISSLPSWHLVERNGWSVLLTHYLYPDLSGSGTTFLPDQRLVQDHERFMKEKKADIALFGHQHPEGLLQVQHTGIKRIRFRRKIRIHPGQIIGIPAVALGRNRHGFALIDWVNQQIKALPLSLGIEDLRS